MVKILFILSALKISLVICKFTYQQDTLEYGELINPIISFFTRRGFSTIRVSVANASNHKTLDIANEILKDAINVKNIVKASKEFIETEEKQRTPVILIIETMTEFKTIEQVMMNDSPKYYLVILTKEIFTNFNKVMKAFWKSSIFNVNFLLKREIFTFFPFSEGNCGEIFNLKSINSFNQTWMNPNIYPNKIKNLERCEVKVGMSPAHPYSMVEINNITNEKIFSGIEVDLLKILSDEFNFSITYQGPISETGTIYNSSSSFGVMSLPHEKKVDLIIGGFSLQLERLKFLSGTVFFKSDPLILVMPAPSTISPFQKLYMPFDIIVWSLLLLMIIIGVITIILSRIKSESFHEIIVGRNVKHPTLNIFAALVGMNQNNLPKKTFSRFLLAKFLLFCLVMRSLYQGKLFDVMRKEIYQTEAGTINELIEMNFKFYTYESLSRRVQGFKFAKK